MTPDHQQLLSEFLVSSRASDEGRTAQSLVDACRSGHLVRVWNGVYLPVGRWEELTPVARYRARLLAAGMRASKGVLFSHQSAAVLHSLSPVTLPTRLEISAVGRPGRRRPPWLLHDLRVPDSGETVFAPGIRGTGLERTVVDCARSLPLLDGVVLADQYLARGGSADRLEPLLDGLEGARGLVRARRAVELADPRSESVAESVGRFRLAQSGLPAAVPQFRVVTERGTVRLDFAWPDWLVAWEIDGRAKYFDYRPTDEALYRERLREKMLQNLGWMILRSAWRDLFSGWEETHGRLRSMLDVQRARYGFRGR